DSIKNIAEAFDHAGIEFLPNSGVRFRQHDVEVFEGPERFNDFSDFIYEHLHQNGGDVCVSAVDEGLFAKFRRDPELHRRRMRELTARGDVSVRILATSSTFASTYATFKWQPRQSAGFTSFYAFGKCLALISFAHEPQPYVVLLKTGP